jgi:hypothetical protein
MGMPLSVNNIFLPEIDKESCFECGSNEELHFHHVVPKSRGGTRTIPLCLDCHGKAHNKKMASGKLIKESMARLIQDGRAFGRPDSVRYGWSVGENKMLVPNHEEQQIARHILELRCSGVKLKEVKEILATQGIKNRNGNPFSLAGISHIYRTFKPSSQIYNPWVEVWERVCLRATNKKTIDIERQSGYAYVNQ